MSGASSLLPEWLSEVGHIGFSDQLRFAGGRGQRKACPSKPTVVFLPIALGQNSLQCSDWHHEPSDWHVRLVRRITIATKYTLAILYCMHGPA